MGLLGAAPDRVLTGEGVDAMERAVRPNPAGFGAPWVVSKTLTDEDVEELFSRKHFPENGLRGTLEEARAAVLRTAPDRLDPAVRARVEAARSWQELIQAIYHGPGEESEWAYALHKATGLHAFFLRYIADPIYVPGPFVFWPPATDDAILSATAAWPWEGIDP